MNYLAHLFLSFRNEELMVGNYIADAVKGKQVERYSVGIQKGIRLHRKIDEFTDTHPVVSHSKSLIRKNYNKYSGVVVDIYFDHFLALQWNNYSETSIQQFTKTAYRTLFKNYFHLPGRMKRILPAMAAGNWLASYAEIENIELALYGMSRRTKFISGMENGGDGLRLHYAELKNDFDLFFPELINFSKDFIALEG